MAQAFCGYVSPALSNMWILYIFCICIMMMDISVICYSFDKWSGKSSLLQTEHVFCCLCSGYQGRE